MFYKDHAQCDLLFESKFLETYLKSKFLFIKYSVSFEFIFILR